MLVANIVYCSQVLIMLSFASWRKEQPKLSLISIPDCYLFAGKSPVRISYRATRGRGYLIRQSNGQYRMYLASYEHGNVWLFDTRSCDEVFTDLLNDRQFWQSPIIRYAVWGRSFKDCVYTASVVRETTLYYVSRILLENAYANRAKRSTYTTTTVADTRVTIRKGKARGFNSGFKRKKK